MPLLRLGTGSSPQRARNRERSLSTPGKCPSDPMCESLRMETATQTLHRLTSYEPGREWDEPIDDPRIVQDLVVNDVDRLPWFYKRYDDALPRIALPRDLPTTTVSAVELLAG